MQNIELPPVYWPSERYIHCQNYTVRQSNQDP